jgi:hypothetical protein
MGASVAKERAYSVEAGTTFLDIGRFLAPCNS